MFSTRTFLAMTALGLGPFIAGCGGNGGVLTFSETSVKSASEERNFTEPHVAGSGIEVRTVVGSVDILAEPSRKDVQVIAKITASGATEEEARARLQDIKVRISRRKDRVLEIVAEYPKEQKVHVGGCSFVVHVPDANGAKAHSSNGSVRLKGLAGTADVDTAVGSINVLNHKGEATARTGNGSIHVTEATGKVQANTSVGQVTVKEAAGDVTAGTGNGSIEIMHAGGKVQAKTSVGAVRVEETSGQVEVETGNGSITYAATPGSKSSFSLRTSVGAVAARLPASVEGSIQTNTSVGAITVNGIRQPRSVTGGRTSKQIVLTENGPISKIHTGTGSITITLE
jgi:hypothetical protein